MNLFARIEAALRLDRRPLSELPKVTRVASAGMIAVVGSLVVDAVLVALGRAVFDPASSFGPFHFSSYAPLTVLGVVAATIGWGILVHLTSVPRWVLRRAAVVVTVALLIPDVAILPGNPDGGVATLMVMHIAIAVITYASLLRVAPARETRSVAVVEAPAFPA
jgi:hypothetical protein